MAARCRCARRGDAGADVDRDAFTPQMRHFLSRTAKDGRIAALQSDHAPPRLRRREQEVVDAFLSFAVAARPLADTHPFHAWRDQAKHPRPYQCIVKDDVGSSDQPFGLAGQEVWIARPRPH